MDDFPYIDDAVSIKKKIEYMKDSNDFNSVNVDWLVRTVKHQQQEIERLKKDEATLAKIAKLWVDIETNGTEEDADDFYSLVQDILDTHEKTI